MNLKQARYIRTIAREGSLTAAARTLHVSQPSLSQMLKLVEGELGAALFDRGTVPFQLTYAGEKYLQAADDILNANARLERQIREIREESRGRLRLGISTQRAIQILPLVMPWFTAQFPHVTLDVTERDSADLEELVIRGEIDLALAALESLSSRLVYELLEEEVIGILAGKKSPLAARCPDGTPIALEVVKGETFVSLKEGHSIRSIQNVLFRRCGLTPHTLLETDSLEAARRVVLGTGSCMLCSNIYLDGLSRRHGVFYPLRDYQNHRHFYACYLRGEPLPRYTAGFVRIVSQALHQEALRMENL